MTVGEVCDVLKTNGVAYSQSVIPNGTGQQLRLEQPYEGAIVNCFDTGTVTVQGNANVAAVKQLLGIK